MEKNIIFIHCLILLTLVKIKYKSEKFKLSISVECDVFNVKKLGWYGVVIFHAGVLVPSVFIVFFKNFFLSYIDTRICQEN